MQALYALILSFIIGLILFWVTDKQIEQIAFFQVQGESQSSMQSHLGWLAYFVY